MFGSLTLEFPDCGRRFLASLAQDLLNSQGLLGMAEIVSRICRSGGLCISSTLAELTTLPKAVVVRNREC